MNNARILILSSNDTVGSIIAYRLELLGNFAFWISSPDQLEAIISGAIPQLVIIDLDHGDGSGIATVEKLSTDIRTCDVSILCLSAEGDLTVADAANRAGAHDFIVVPFDMLLLEKKVQDLLTRAKTSRGKALAGSVGTPA